VPKQITEREGQDKGPHWEKKKKNKKKRWCGEEKRKGKAVPVRKLRKGLGGRSGPVRGKQGGKKMGSSRNVENQSKRTPGGRKKRGGKYKRGVTWGLENQGGGEFSIF